MLVLWGVLHIVYCHRKLFTLMYVHCMLYVWLFVHRILTNHAGPSVLDIFRTLVRHLRVSIETPSEGASALTSSQTFQQSITKTVGEFAGVLPDYHKPDILGLINSYVPMSNESGAKDRETAASGLAIHPLVSDDNNRWGIFYLYPILSEGLQRILNFLLQF